MLSFKFSDGSLTLMNLRFSLSLPKLKIRSLGFGLQAYEYQSYSK